jgi:uncharacterized protein (TIGR03067 family)
MAAALAFLLPLGLWADAPPVDDPTIDDLRDFQGRWQVVAMKKDGAAVPESRWKDLQWSFQDNRLIQYAGAITCRQGRFRSERTHNPAEMLIAYAIGRPACYTFRIRGDQLEVAESDSGEPPQGFTPDRGCDKLFILRRIHK